MQTNAVTLAIFLCTLGVWLPLELYLLWRRAQKGPKPGTISMVLRDARFHLTGTIYLLSGLLVHWFVPWRAATVAGSVAFWVLALGLFAWDLVLWKRPVETWPVWLVTSRDPPLWLLAGALSGLVLFPQGA